MKSKQKAMNLQHKLAIQQKEEMAARAKEAKAKQDALGGEVDYGWNNSKGSKFVNDVITKAVELGLNKILAHISVDQKQDLEGEVTNDEIKKAVWDCGTDKAPGPDEFTFVFYRKFWYLIDNDVCDAVRFFFKNDNIPNGCNSSFIALIPKIPNVNMVKDIRPISLVGSVYKIIAKILANRLVGVLGDTVSEVQSTFIAGRQILDGSFILNEVLQWCKIKKKQALIFKVDFEKAYDSVRWDFLDEVLNKFGFGEKWCKWIQACLKSSRGSVIINGSPTEEF
nr:RNA-directed DNA polymerase, eukaryota, reverse transcriptase zinc-binding domain protein [Tanacetum cinerariifolium]